MCCEGLQEALRVLGQGATITILYKIPSLALTQWLSISEILQWGSRLAQPAKLLGDTTPTPIPVFFTLVIPASSQGLHC